MPDNPNAGAAKAVLSPKELRDELGLSQSLYYRQLALDQLPRSIRVGGKRLFPRAEVDRWMRERLSAGN